jgi:hypothetical protein
MQISSNNKKKKVGTVQKSKILKHRGKIDTRNTHIHDRSLPWLGIGTSIQVCGVKLNYKYPISVVE